MALETIGRSKFDWAEFITTIKIQNSLDSYVHKFFTVYGRVENLKTDLYKTVIKIIIIKYHANAITIMF